MFHNLWHTFWELVNTPFQHQALIWGIVPLYFGWFINELTSSKATFQTAIQTGFSFLWAGIQWVYPIFISNSGLHRLKISSLFAVNVFVTLVVLAIGLLALWSGIRKKYPPYGSFLGHTRFGNYFMILIFPIQANFLSWTLSRFLAILLFAIPVWIVISMVCIPLRLKR